MIEADIRLTKEQIRAKYQGSPEYPSHRHDCECSGCFASWIEWRSAAAAYSLGVASAAKEIETLRAGLEGIANDPHCVYPQDAPYESEYAWGMRSGIVDGHRCAATKARATLAAVDKGEKGDGK